jgi:hypothetical protein
MSSIYDRFETTELREMVEHLTTQMETVEQREGKAKSMGMTQFAHVLHADWRMMYERRAQINAILDKRITVGLAVQAIRTQTLRTGMCEVCGYKLYADGTCSNHECEG